MEKFYCQSTIYATSEIKSVITPALLYLRLCGYLRSVYRWYTDSCTPCWVIPRCDKPAERRGPTTTGNRGRCTAPKIYGHSDTAQARTISKQCPTLSTQLLFPVDIVLSETRFVLYIS